MDEVLQVQQQVTETLNQAQQQHLTRPELILQNLGQMNYRYCLCKSKSPVLLLFLLST
jgi:hypothetical protein